MIALSPGLAQGCFELLGIASRHSLTFPQIQTSFAYFGNLPGTAVTEAAQRLQWLRANDEGHAVITPSGSRLLALSGYEPMLRQALLDYIDVERPPWVQNASFGRSRVLRFAGSAIAQVFVEANLANGTEDEVVAFWDALAARARGQKEDRLTQIGREGERLTLTYEESRTERKPRWVAIENNEDGYDVLSVLASNDSGHLSIEVKASTMGTAGSFHLTRNEWDRSTELDNHLFHLWALRPNSKPLLAIVTPKDMQNHIPCDSGSGCWESVEVPFVVFQDSFRSPPFGGD
jgi:hypothetical protein